jgi:AraC-like DNA-binding protein
MPADGRVRFDVDGRLRALPRPCWAERFDLAAGAERVYALRGHQRARAAVVVCLSGAASSGDLPLPAGMALVHVDPQEPMPLLAACAAQVLVVAFDASEDLVGELAEHLPGAVPLSPACTIVGQLVACTTRPDAVLPLTRADGARIVCALVGALIDQRYGDGVRPLGSRPVREAVALLNDQVETIASVAALAARVGVSPEHLARAFRAELGTTPAELLAERRIQAACRLLRATLMPVAEVGARLGWSDPDSFARAFRERTGLPPSRWRELRSAPPPMGA